MEPPINNMQFRHIIIPTYVMPAINSLPKPSPLDSTQRWLVAAVTLLVLNHKTTMIDRALAEDLASAFEVEVSEIPSDITEIMDFIYRYSRDYLKYGSVNDLMHRLNMVAQRLQILMANIKQQHGL